MKRERSEYIFDLSLSLQQWKALIRIAKNQDREFWEVLMEAIDQYIEREKETCR